MKYSHTSSSLRRGKQGCCSLRNLVVLSWSVVLLSLVVYQMELHNSILLFGTPSESPPPFLDEEQQRRNENQTTLVILLGNLRGGELAWKTLKQHVLDPNRADLALLVGGTRPEYQNSSLMSLAKYHWPVVEYDDWGEALNQIHPSWKTQVLPLMKKNRSDLLGGVQGQPKLMGSGAVIFSLRYFLSQKIEELQLTQAYDRFVITRSDHYYVCTHDLAKLNLHYMWVPQGEEYGGLTDRHLVVGKQWVLQALDILPPLFAHPQRYKDALAFPRLNPEMFLALRWKEEGIPIQQFPRVMFTCAVPGDTTRHMCMSAKVVEGVHLKYLTEYNASYSGCGLSVSDSNFLTPAECVNKKIKPPA